MGEPLLQIDAPLLFFGLLILQIGNGLFKESWLDDQTVNWSTLAIREWPVTKQ
jgi:hypothetical protein